VRKTGTTGVLMVAVLLVLGACAPTPTPVPEPMPSPTTPPPTEKPVDYASLSLVTMERTNEVKLKPKVVKLGEETIETDPEASVFGITHTVHTLQPGKGMDALILMVRIENPAQRYIFPNVMPGYLYDTEGEEYREEGEAVKCEPKTPESLYTEILVKELNWVKVLPSSSATEDIIAPGESYDWVFIFHITTERNPSRFSFRYAVGETADPLVGEYEDGESSIPLTTE